MTLVSEELRQGVRKYEEELKNLDDPSKSLRPSVAVAKMIGPQSSEAELGGHVVKSDEAKSVGGGDSAPTPSSIFAATIGFAENVLFARNAAMKNLDFDWLETRVEAIWDRKGLFQLDGKDPSISMISIETRISASIPVEKVVELLRLTHKTSPMTATLAKCVTIRRKLFVNGSETKV
jgi:uncharacterized OsmC-like protein